MKHDKTFMALALRLAKKADPYPNPRVGAVLVKGGGVLGTGYHRRAGMPHAEIEAIEDAKRRTGNPAAARGSVLYVTLEPCSHTAKRTPPCTKEIIAAGIRRVVFGMSDPNPLVSGAKELRERHIAVIGPVCQKEAAAMNQRYSRSVSKKPFVAIKMAMSADGRTATRTGDSKWISCAHSRECVRRMRGDFGAVMVGAGTILKDNPRLTARTRGVPDPYRIIVDGGLCISTTAKVLGRDDGKTIIATSGKAKKQKIRSLQSRSQPGMRPLILVCGKSDVDLRVLVTALGAMGIRKILVEGGSELNARLIEAGIVDRIYLFVAPLLIGGRNARGVIGGVGPACVAAALRLKPARTRRIGQDLLLEYDPSK